MPMKHYHMVQFYLFYRKVVIVINLCILDLVHLDPMGIPTQLL